MRAMPAGGKWMLRSCVEINNIDSAFAEAQRDLKCFDKAHPIFRVNYNPILNDLDTHTESFDFFVRIDAHNFIVDPNA